MSKLLLFLLLAIPGILTGGPIFRHLPMDLIDYTVNQSGNWHATGAANPFTPNGTPGFGDTITNNQYVLTCESALSCSVGTVNSTAITLGDGTHAATLIDDGTLVVRGSINLQGAVADCVNAPTFQMGTGSSLQLDQNGGSVASGLVTPASSEICTHVILGNPGDVCTWGTSSPPCPTNITSINNGSANGVLLLDSGGGFGDSVTNFNGVAINKCGSASIPCYQAEMYRAQTSWVWKQLFISNSSWLGANTSGGGVGSSASPITIDSTIFNGSTRLSGTDIYFGAECNQGVVSPFAPACTGTRSVTNSLLRDMSPSGFGDPFTMGMTIANVYWDGLGADYPSLTAANVLGGSWSYVVAACDLATCSENDPANTEILAPTADHIYSLATAVSGVPLLLIQPSNRNWGTNVSLSNVIFDLEAATAGGGHCYLYGNDGASDSGYSVTLSYVTVLLNSTLGYGCGFTQWSDLCPSAPTTSITHLFSPGGPSIGPWYACEGNTNAAAAPALSVYKGNIFYDSSARVNPLMFGNSNAANQPANVVPPTGVDYNVNYNFVPFVTTPYTTACASGCTNSGSPYAVPMTGSAPGAHDMNVNPMMANLAVSGLTWASANGQAASAAGFRQAFINGGPARIQANIDSLFAYICTGYVPTNSAIFRALPDGTTPGSCQVPASSSAITRGAVAGGTIQ